MSLTQRCNLICAYCHHEGETAARGEMSATEVLRIVKTARDLGITRIKYTGGEPLLRADIVEIVEGSVGLNLEDVSLTTNGTLLAAYSRQLAGAGLRRINVSLPSVRPAVYASLTGGDLGIVMDGLRGARDAGIRIKINSVIMKGVNEGEIYDLISLAASLGGELQLIELENLNLDPEFFKKHYQDLGAIENDLASRADRIVSRHDMNDRKRYVFQGLTVEVVRPMGNPRFCARCSRLRLTSSGMLKPCLMRDGNLVDLIGPMRSGCSDQALKGLFLKAVGFRAPYY